jgi:hypothetical protein
MTQPAHPDLAVPEDDRPWERPGAMRRDVVPHRAGMLWRLAVPAVVCGLLAVFLWAPAFIALPLGLIAWLLARHDLAEMDAGRMDSRGRAETEQARDWAVAGAIAAVSTLLCYTPALFSMFPVLPNGGVRW